MYGIWWIDFEVEVGWEAGTVRHGGQIPNPAQDPHFADHSVVVRVFMFKLKFFGGSLKFLQ